ncbi:MAG: RlmE family RNA methyltransferase [Desulfovibrio sp.]|nr:RlmE family RNA methyltransferase [Desulfovibrio sp.]
MKEYRDHYFLKAKQENYPARSVYKLQEIEAKFHLLFSGAHVLDLGACPGSWSLWAAKKVGKNGRVLAADLHTPTVTFPPEVLFLKEDVFAISPAFAEQLEALGPFDLVLSDMAPKTTGTRFTDQARSFDLALAALDLAKDHLKSQGSFVVKIFMGPDVPEMLSQMRKHFRSVKTFKPKSSRAESKETFLIGLGFLQQKPSAC